MALNSTVLGEGVAKAFNIFPREPEEVLKWTRCCVIYDDDKARDVDVARISGMKLNSARPRLHARHWNPRHWEYTRSEPRYPHSWKLKTVPGSKAVYPPHATKTFVPPPKGNAVYRTIETDWLPLPEPDGERNPVGRPKSRTPAQSPAGRARLSHRPGLHSPPLSHGLVVLLRLI